MVSPGIACYLSMLKRDAYTRRNTHPHIHTSTHPHIHTSTHPHVHRLLPSNTHASLTRPSRYTHLHLSLPRDAHASPIQNILHTHTHTYTRAHQYRPYLQQPIPSPTNAALNTRNAHMPSSPASMIDPCPQPIRKDHASSHRKHHQKFDTTIAN
jgi:hypothetical protein